MFFSAIGVIIVTILNFKKYTNNIVSALFLVLAAMFCTPSISFPADIPEDEKTKASTEASNVELDSYSGVSFKVVSLDGVDTSAIADLQWLDLHVEVASKMVALLPLHQKLPYRALLDEGYDLRAEVQLFHDGIVQMGGSVQIDPSFSDDSLSLTRGAELFYLVLSGIGDAPHEVVVPQLLIKHPIQNHIVSMSISQSQRCFRLDNGVDLL